MCICMHVCNCGNLGQRTAAGLSYAGRIPTRSKDGRRSLVLDLFLQPIPQPLSKFVIVSFWSTSSLSGPWDQKLTIIMDCLGHSARPQLCESAIWSRIQHEFLVPIRTGKSFRQTIAHDCYPPQRTSGWQRRVSINLFSDSLD